MSAIKASPYKEYIYPSLAVPFSTASDADLAKMVNGYYNGDVTLDEIKAKNPIGSKRKIHINAMSATGVSESHHADDYYFVIIGINHDDLTTPINGITKALFTIQTERILFKDTTTESYNFTWSNSEECGYMDSSGINAGGWNGCARRTWCNNVFVNALPTSIQSIVKTVNKKTSAGGNQSSSIITSEDKAFLLSEVEIFGATTHSFAGEGTQYEYFKTTANRNKKPVNNTNSSTIWWERSPSTNPAFFCYVNFDGNAIAGYYTNLCFGLAAALCL